MGNTKYLTTENAAFIPDILHTPLEILPGHPDYGVDYEGNVYHAVNGRLKIMHPYVNGNYLAVRLDGTICSVSRLVASVYIENKDPRRNKVFHIDGNILNNAVDNLVWVTAKEVNELTVMEIRERKKYLYDRDQHEYDINLSL